MTLRTGLTTGTCAAAAAKAAASVLVGWPAPASAEVSLPSGQMVSIPVLGAWRNESVDSATAAVRKDAGDDADVTHAAEVRATVSWNDTDDITFAAGEGVGIVTKPGLQVPPGEPAINPVPRRMIAAAVREVTQRGVRVEIAIPGGAELAGRTFNPRLGIVGGLSILGTTGIVRPHCRRAMLDALKCTLDVARACGVTAPVLVPGNIGARAARQLGTLRDEQVVEVGNEWGYVLEMLSGYDFQAVMLLGHPGKLAKLAAGHWDTHSSRSPPATDYLDRLCRQTLLHPAPECPTVEGMFAALPAPERTRLAAVLAERIGTAVVAEKGLPSVAICLVDMAGRRLGTWGDFSRWG